MKKRNFLSIILLFTLLLCVLAFSACNDDAKNGDDNNNANGEAAECQHEFTVLSGMLPTCEEAGYNRLICNSCGITKDTLVDPLGHPYTASWEWGEDYTYAFVRLNCPVSESHAKYLSCVVTEELVPSTCQAVGARKITATTTVGGVEYTDTKEFALELGKCKNTYNFSLNGNSCEDGFDMEATCTVCGAKSYASFQNHVVFDLASFKVCGGEALVRACPCGENSELYYPDGCNAEVENDKKQEADENGTVHTIEHKFCIRCDFEIIYDSYATNEGCYSFYNRDCKIMDGEKVLYSFTQRNYEIKTWHELIYSYEGEEIDSCENGFTYHEACKKCDYEADVYSETHTHTFLASITDLAGLGACGGYIQKRQCPCGNNEEISFSFDCDYDYDYEEKEINGEFHTVKTYTCQECQMKLVYDQYIKDESVYASYTLAINGEIKYENEHKIAD